MSEVPFESQVTQPEEKDTTKIWGLIIVNLILLSAIYFEMKGLRFNKVVVRDLPGILSHLMLVALFLERATEVFLSVWRGWGADQLDMKIRIERGRKQKLRETHDALLEEKKQHLALGEAKETLTHFDEKIAATEKAMRHSEEVLSDVQEQRLRWRGGSRNRALWMGLISGMILSAIGIRTLENMLVTDSLTDWYQKTFFTIVDIFITGCVLAGGSDAINKIYKVYDAFMTKTKDSAGKAILHPNG